MIRWRRFVGLMLGIVFLQALALVPLHATHTWAVAMPRLSADLLVVAGIAGIGALAGWPRLAAYLGSLVLVVATLLRNALEILPAVFLRPFELADFAQLPGLVHLLTVNRTTSQQVLLWSAIGGALLLAFVLAAWSLRAVAACALVGRGRGLALLVVQILLVAAYLAPARAWQPSALLQVADLAVGEVRNRLDPAPEESRLRARIEAGRVALAAAPQKPERLAGVDVYVLVVESYGATSLRQPEVAAHFTGLWQTLRGELERAGFHGMVGFASPAIIGGSSWLSHMELFTAVRTDRQRVWERVLQTDNPALPKILRDAGWRTVEVMPAMDRHWPEGQDFYGFDRSATQLEMPYTGHVYPWGRMPDQFALHWLLHNEVAKVERPPLFAAFMSVSSHAPWAKTPPYVADWNLDANTFAAEPKCQHPTTWLDVPSGKGLVPAYRDGLEYALRTAVGFTTRLTRPSLVVILGDHQPPIGWTQEPADRSFDVPLHVLSNRPELLAPWGQHGMVEGYVPPAGTPSRPLAEFAPALLRSYAK
ncbi:MAG: hypothetical protein JNK15_01530 [Planctomycetes bacterium]|nr:hypothetical protein [Planctomycetota bacterium]